MIRSVVTAATLGVLGAAALTAPAHASDFSLTYNCQVPVLGQQSITLEGSLTATPNPATAGSPVNVDAHLAKASLSSPLDINSWSLTATVNVSGAETSSFTIKGSGGSVPAGQPVTGDASGTWTPTAAGTDELRGGDATVSGNVALLGDVSATCSPVAPVPVGETVTVN